jgi:predicted metal-dependent hydrolase
VKQAKETQPKKYVDGQKIGASHTLQFILSEVATSRGSISGTTIKITVPKGKGVLDDDIQATARRTVRRALQKQAESYLPRQLRYLAEQHGFVYSQITFGNAKGRWGSCTSKGVIRLNIALMKLPLGLIDYVLVHELSHTKELNHSSRFWSLVESAYPHYKSARKQLKQFTPYL